MSRTLYVPGRQLYVVGSVIIGHHYYSDDMSSNHVFEKKNLVSDFSWVPMLVLWGWVFAYERGL